MNGEKGLASAVISRALGDLFILKQGEIVGLHNTIAGEEAKAFLTAERGRWYDMRVMWCDMADVNAEALRQSVIDKMEKLTCR